MFKKLVTVYKQGEFEAEIRISRVGKMCAYHSDATII
jgi:hypothetical protein